MSNNIKMTAEFDGDASGIKAAGRQAEQSIKGVANAAKHGNNDLRTLTTQSVFLKKAWSENASVIDKRYLSSVKGLREAMRRFNAEAAHTVVVHEKQLKMLNDNTLGFERYRLKADLVARTLQNMSTKVVNAGKNMQWTGRQMMVGITLPLLGIAAASTKAYLEINKLDIQLQKLLDDGDQSFAALESDLKGLTEQSIKLSETWGINAAEIKGIQTTFAAVGFGAGEIEKLTKATTEFAMVGDIAQDQASEVVRVLRQSGLTFKETADQLARFNLIEDQTNLSMQEIAGSFTKVFPVMNQYGVTASETAALIGGITQAGFEATEAADTLRFAMTKLPAGLAMSSLGGDDNSRRLKALIEDLETINELTDVGISFRDSEGEVRSGVDMLMQLSQAFQFFNNEMADSQGPELAARILRDMFGTEQAAKGQQLMEAMADSAGDLAKGLSIARDESTAAADAWTRQLGIILGSDSVQFQAQVQKLINSAREFGKKIIPSVIKAFDMLNNLIDKFFALPEGWQDTIIKFGAGLAALGPIVYAVGQSMIAAGTIFKGLMAPIAQFFRVTSRAGDAIAGAAEFEGAIEELRDAFRKGAITQDEYLDGVAELTGETKLQVAQQHALTEASNAHTAAETREAAAIDGTTAAMARQGSAAGAMATSKGEATVSTAASRAMSATASLMQPDIGPRPYSVPVFGEGIEGLDSDFSSAAMAQIRDDFTKEYVTQREATDRIIKRSVVDFSHQAFNESRQADFSDAEETIGLIGSRDALNAFARQAGENEVGSLAQARIPLADQQAEIKERLDRMLSFEGETGLPVPSAMTIDPTMFDEFAMNVRQKLEGTANADSLLAASRAGDSAPLQAIIDETVEDILVRRMDESEAFMRGIAGLTGAKVDVDDYGKSELDRIVSSTRRELREDFGVLLSKPITPGLERGQTMQQVLPNVAEIRQTMNQGGVPAPFTYREADALFGATGTYDIGETNRREAEMAAKIERELQRRISLRETGRLGGIKPTDDTTVALVDAMEAQIKTVEGENDPNYRQGIPGDKMKGGLAQRYSTVKSPLSTDRKTAFNETANSNFLNELRENASIYMQRMGFKTDIGMPAYDADGKTTEIGLEEVQKILASGDEAEIDTLTRSLRTTTAALKNQVTRINDDWFAQISKVSDSGDMDEVLRIMRTGVPEEYSSIVSSMVWGNARPAEVSKKIKEITSVDQDRLAKANTRLDMVNKPIEDLAQDIATKEETLAGIVAREAEVVSAIDLDGGNADLESELQGLRNRKKAAMDRINLQQERMTDLLFDKSKVEQEIALLTNKIGGGNEIVVNRMAQATASELGASGPAREFGGNADELSVVRKLQREAASGSGSLDSTLRERLVATGDEADSSRRRRAIIERSRKVMHDAGQEAKTLEAEQAAMEVEALKFDAQKREARRRSRARRVNLESQLAHPDSSDLSYLTPDQQDFYAAKSLDDLADYEASLRALPNSFNMTEEKISNALDDAIDYIETKPGNNSKLNVDLREYEAMLRGLPASFNMNEDKINDAMKEAIASWRYYNTGEVPGLPIDVTRGVPDAWAAIENQERTDIAEIEAREQQHAAARGQHASRLSAVLGKRDAAGVMERALQEGVSGEANRAADLDALWQGAGTGRNPITGVFTGKGSNLQAIVGTLTPEAARLVHEVSAFQIQDINEARAMVRGIMPGLSAEMTDEFARAAVDIGSLINNDLDRATLLFGEEYTDSLLEGSRRRQEAMAQLAGQGSISAKELEALEQAAAEGKPLPRRGTGSSKPKGPRRIGSQDETNLDPMVMSQMLEAQEPGRRPEIPGVGNAQSGTGGNTESEIDRRMMQYQREVKGKKLRNVSRAVAALETELAKLDEEQTDLVSEHGRKRKAAIERNRRRLTSELDAARAVEKVAKDELEDLFVDIYEVEEIDGTTTRYDNLDGYNQRIAADADAAFDNIRGDANIVTKAEQLEEEMRSQLRKEKELVESMKAEIMQRNAEMIDTRLDDDIEKANRAQARRSLLLGQAYAPVSGRETNTRALMQAFDVANGMDATTYNRQQVEMFERQAQQLMPTAFGSAGPDLPASMMPDGGAMGVASFKGLEGGMAQLPATGEMFATGVAASAIDARRETGLFGRALRGLGEAADDTNKRGSFLTRRGGLVNAATWLNPMRAIKGMGGGIKSLFTGVDSLKLKEGSGITSMLTMFMGPGMGGSIAGVISAVAPFLPLVLAIGAGIAVIWANWDKISPAIEAAGNGLRRLGVAFGKLKDAVVGPFLALFDRLSGADASKAGQGMESMWERIGRFIEVAADKLATFIAFIAPVVQRIGAFIAMVAESSINIWQAAAAALDGDWSEAWDHIREVGNLFMNWLRNTVATLAGELVSLILKIPMALMDALELVAGLLDQIIHAIFKQLGPLEGILGSAFAPVEVGVMGIFNSEAWNNTKSEIATRANELGDQFADWVRPEEDYWAGGAEDAGEQVKEGFDKGLHEGKPPILPEPDPGPAEDAAEDAAKDIVNNFINAFQSQMRKIVDGWKQSALDAFDVWAEAQKASLEKQKESLDAWGEKQTEAIDAKLEAIDKEIKKEKERDEDLDYLRRKEELREKKRSSRIRHQTDRDLAIYEGRYDDAKQLDYDFSQEQKELDNQSEQLEDDRNQTLLDRAREHEKELLDIQREGVEKRLEAKKEELDKQQEMLDASIESKREALQRELDLLTEYIPKNAAEAARMQQTILDTVMSYLPQHTALANQIQSDILNAMNGRTLQYGVIGANQAGLWALGWANAFSGAQRQVAEEAYWAGEKAMAEFASALGIDPSLITGSGGSPGTASAGIGPSGGKDTHIATSADTINWDLLTGTPYGRPFHTGGAIGPANSNPHDIPATLQSGEFVMRRSAVSKYGHDFMGALNSGELPTFHAGGMVGIAAGAMNNAFGNFVQRFKEGGAKVLQKVVGGKLTGGFSVEDLKAAYSAAASPESAFGGGMTGSGNLAGVHPALVKAFHDYNAALGGILSVGPWGGFRSFEQQASLYAKYGPGRAAPPGSSNHEYGLAIDHSPDATAAMKAVARRFNINYRVPGEPWHMELDGLVHQNFDRPPGPWVEESREMINDLKLKPGFITPASGSISGGPPSAVKALVRAMMARFGWGDSEWGSLEQLVQHESGWNPNAQNPTSTASGLFQFLDSTWRNYGHDYPNFPRDPATQAQAGLSYIKSRYGSPSAAWSFWNRQSPHWYHEGGPVFNVPSLDVGGRILGDGFAKVHRGENVFTEKQSQAFGNMGGDIIFDIKVEGPFYGSDRELEDLASRIATKVTPKMNRARGMENRTFKSRVNK